MKKANKIKYYQQGDVILIKTDKGVSGDKIPGVVVQEGEHTGHAHRFNGQEDVAQLFGSGGTREYLALNDTATLYHEEHLPVTIEKGDYEIRIVRQKDPFTKLVSRVVD